jgi:hypothetical protein
MHELEKEMNPKIFSLATSHYHPHKKKVCKNKTMLFIKLNTISRPEIY